MRSFLLFGLLLGAFACGSTVETTPTSTSGAGGTGSTGATGSSTSAGKTTSATSGAGGSGACVGSTIDVSVNNGAPIHYSSICQGSWGANETQSAVAYEFSGGPAPGTQALKLVGCVSSAAASEGLDVGLKNATAPGTFIDGSLTWTDPMGVQWGSPGDQLSFTVTKYEPSGGIVEGSFTAFASHGGNAANSLSGTFHLCHVNDELAP